MKRQLLLVFAACCLLTLNTQAQTMKAVTTPGGPGLHVVLTWPSKSPTARYNLYRKVAGAASYPATPLNSAPLARPAPAACANIKAVIPPGSPEWTAIAEGIQSGTPFDPCNISTLAANSAPESKLQFLARTRWKIAVAAGQGDRKSVV